MDAPPSGRSGPATLPAPLGHAPRTPAQLAKAALLRLAQERLEPTPDNYARAYRAEAGEPAAAPAEAAGALKVLERLIERQGLGAELAYEGESVVARFATGEVRFTAGSPVVSVGGEARTLGSPVYSDGGLVWVPVEFFARHLADAAGGAVQVEVADRVLVLHHGELLAEGTPAEIRADERVRRVYLGQRA